MSARSCARCGKTPPDGYASIYEHGVERWFCHPDDGPDCYLDQSHGETSARLETYL